MINEEKQALIDWAKSDIAALQVRLDCAEPGDTFIPYVKQKIQISKIALAALTAQPVKLPKSYFCDRNSGSDDFMPLHDSMLVKSQVIDAIREAGYEVQE